MINVVLWHPPDEACQTVGKRQGTHLLQTDMSSLFKIHVVSCHPSYDACMCSRYAILRGNFVINVVLWQPPDEAEIKLYGQPI